MIPKNFDGYSYPVFQPDQLLSADHLNHAFEFNEQEERLTRTNLIGIGIVCGLKATKSADGSLITISKGTGVTSHGYLITHGKENSEEAIEYRQWRPYNMQQTSAYDLFWADGVQKYALYELLSAEEADSKDSLLDNDFLQNKVCLVFYEKMEVDAKNCDTTSCDDRGRTITVTIRKLLIHENDAAEIIQECYERANLSGSQILFPLPTPVYVPTPFPGPRPKVITATQRLASSVGSLPFTLPPVLYTTSDTLPDLRMPRYDVTATPLETAYSIREAYQQIFSQSFIQQTGAAFMAVHQALKGYLGLGANPFTTFRQTFSFLYDGNISGNDLLHFQYYYDFFSDLMLAYAELKESSYKTGALCTPPEALFPRHLFLGKLSETNTRAKSRYRTYFIPSPVTARQEDAYQETKSLYERLLRMINNFELPVPSAEPADDRENFDTNIRITPTQIGKAPLGDRAIPYYYNPLAPDALLDAWSYPLGKRGLQHQNLGYFATDYNRSDAFVRTPLRYDIEPYNFFRVEGHIGKRMETALATIQAIRDEYRLPFDVVPVNAGTYTLPDMDRLSGHFNDLDLQYQVLRNEIWCRLNKARECICALPIRIDKDPTKPNVEPLSLHPEEILHTQTNIRSILDDYQAALEQGTDAQTNMLKLIEQLNIVRTTIIQPDEADLNILCDVYQKYKEELLKGEYIDKITLSMRKDLNSIRSRTRSWATVEVEANIQFVLMLSLLDQYKQLLSDKFNELNMDALHNIQGRMDDVYEQLVKLNPTQGLSCISGIKNMCLNEDLNILYTAYQERLDKLIQSLTLAEFSKAHPGLQHKAGVPTGGTLVLVYQQSRREIIYNDILDTLPSQPVFEEKMAQPTLEEKVAQPAFEGKATQPKAVQPPKSAVLDPYNGRVIADFYLPYLCCSDCPSVQVTIAAPAPAELLFTLPQREYCSDYMPERIPFKMSPLGGTIITDTPEALEYGLNDSMVYFVPGRVNFADGIYRQDLTFTYQVNNSSIPFSVRVYRQPNVTMALEKDADNPRLIRFSLNRTEQVTQAFWNFGDGTTSSSLAGEHLYTASGKFMVQVQVWNGTCAYTPDSEVIGISALEPIKIGELPKEVCQKSEEFAFEIYPPGGTISGVKFDEIYEKEEGAGTYVVVPSQVNLDTVGSKTVAYLYTAPAGNTHPFNITYYAMPSGRATLGAEDKGMVMLQLSNLRFVRSVRVNDGKDTQEYFIRGNTYNVLLDDQFNTKQLTVTLHNGPCSITAMQGEATTDPTAPEAHSCQSLSVPVNAFMATYEELDKNQTFTELYGRARYEAVIIMFKAIAAELFKGPQYATDYVQKRDIVQPDWISAIPFDKPEVQTPSLKLLAILTDLVTTISCINQEDVNQGNYTTIKQLEEIKAKIDQIPNTPTAQDNRLLDDIKKDVYNEIDRLGINGGYQKKPVFLQKLKEIGTAAQNAQKSDSGNGGTTPRSRSCQPLNVTLNNFEALLPALQNESFKQTYGPDLTGIVIAYFSSITMHWKPEDPKQAIDFVLNNKFMSDFWFTQLPVNSPEHQTTALGLLSVLSDLVTTISCLKEDDTPSGMVETGSLLMAINAKIQEVYALQSTQDFTYVNQMLADIQDEQGRMNTNGDLMNKPAMGEQLMKLYAELNSLQQRSNYPQPPLENAE